MKTESFELPAEDMLAELEQLYTAADSFTIPDEGTYKVRFASLETFTKPAGDGSVKTYAAFAFGPTEEGMDGLRPFFQISTKGGMFAFRKFSVALGGRAKTLSELFKALTLHIDDVYDISVTHVLLPATDTYPERTIAQYTVS